MRYRLIALAALATSLVAAAPPVSHDAAPRSLARAAAVAPGGQQHGYALNSWNSSALGGPEAGRDLGAIKANGAGWVELTPTWYQTSPGSTGIAASTSTPTDESLLHAIGVAHRDGLRVLLKPHVDVADGTWRGQIRPADRTRWFASYTRFIDRYARLAQQAGVEEFSVGTELQSMSGDTHSWQAVIASVRGLYRGPLVYAANFTEFHQVRFWRQLDLIGVDAYWSVASRPTTDVAAMRRAWAPIAAQLQALSVQQGRRILFTEAGYTSQRGAAVQPWSWNLSHTPAPAEQAAAYDALLSVFSPKSWWAGVDFWEWDELPGQSPSAHTLGYAASGKAAAAVTHRWWAGQKA